MKMFRIRWWLCICSLVAWRCAPAQDVGEPLAPAHSSSPASSPASPVEEWIVFASGRSGDGDIYALDPTSGEIKPVVATPAGEGTVRYDLTRDRLVHHRFDDEGAMLVSGEEDLFVDPNGDVAPSWSPDGRWIVYADNRDGQDDLFLAKSDGTGERRLTRDAAIDRYPAWSPDSRRIVFAKRLSSGWDLHLLTLDSEEVERLPESGTYVGHPAWSPDGEAIAFDTLFDDQAEIAVIDLASGIIKRITHRAGNDLIPAWSSDGRRIAFGGEPTAGNWDLWLVDLDKLELQRLTTHESYDGGPVFVPASSFVE
ncbi:MAG: hypothetical protein AAGF97_11145 [Planctomycetota bacterium]